MAQRWQASTDTQETFARRHGVSRSALQYWLRQGAAHVATATAAFAPVQVTTPLVVGGGASVEILLVSGERVVVPPHASVDQVRVVLAALRPSC